MSKDAPLKQVEQEEKHRDLHPDVLQRRASDPGASVWVSASAGTGKTKVLTDRVLRLLLPGPEGRPGTPAHRILCLTFTKAAAAEMALRISKTLSGWAILPEKGPGDEKSLSGELEKLFGRSPLNVEKQAARRLFAEVMDDPGGLQIMTIHAFCQSVLGRFPLEAGISPNFKILEEIPAAALLQEAKNRVLRQAGCERAGPLHEALNILAQELNEEQFFKLLLDCQKEHHQLDEIMRQNFSDPQGLYTWLCAAIDIKPGLSPEEVKTDFIEKLAARESSLRAVCAVLSEGTPKSDQPKGETIQRWLDMDAQSRLENFDLFKGCFIKKDGDPYTEKSLMTSQPARKYPQLLKVLLDEQALLLELQDEVCRAQCAALSRALFVLVTEILKVYRVLKDSQNALDFDDLITCTLRLLKGDSQENLKDMSGWVHYKLDQGLDHILVDEAQDTNPQQWQVIEALCEDFFAGQSARDHIERTVFTVGDEKQSIYSFQRASPREFQRMHDHFARKVSQAGKSWQPVDLNISFRSTKSVLQAVDAVYASESMRRGLGLKPVEHNSFRSGQAGQVELWPLYENEKTEEDNPWAPPVEVVETATGAAQLAGRIAGQIKGWLREGEILPARGRAVRPGDILILVRTRGPLAEQIKHALKLAQIPVSGDDRMVLRDQLAVQDLMAAAEFGLLPEDELNLACLLKSPLIGLDEEALFDVCYGREKTLWQSVRENLSSEITDYLDGLIQKSNVLAPFEFFSWLLQNPCPADVAGSALRAMKRRLGPDILDPLEELLNAALAYEADHVPSLQNFLFAQKQVDTQVRREIESVGNAVRIMTVHGSKGLQAPVVFLPDTVRTSRNVPGQSNRRLLWPEKTGLEVPLWAPRKDLEYRLYRQASERLENQADEEYRRLLYVAMTRAEDRLYIAGATGKKKPIEESWYNYAAAGLKFLREIEVLEDGTLRLSNPQVREPDKPEKDGHAEETEKGLPDWVSQSPPPEPHPVRPLVPSRPAETEPAAFSPLKVINQQRFRRGNLTHKLLQVLPDLLQSSRPVAGQQYLDSFAADMPESVRAEILKETLAVLDDPEFAPLFGPGSRAEVPVTGLLGEDTLISGQVDRLLITDEKIWIVDFKTNRPAPEKPEDIPPLYLDQIKAYRDALAQIYPGRMIQCGLLWTDGPRLMAVDRI